MFHNKSPTVKSFCEMSRIGHDVGIWWYLSTKVHENKIIILALSGAGNPSRWPGIWDSPRLSTFSPLFVCTRLGDSWDWADPFADSITHFVSVAYDDSLLAMRVLAFWGKPWCGSASFNALTQTVPFVHMLPRLWIWCNQPRQEASYFLKYGSMRMKHTSDGQKRCCFCGICWGFCPL